MYDSTLAESVVEAFPELDDEDQENQGNEGQEGDEEETDETLYAPSVAT